MWWRYAQEVAVTTPELESHWGEEIEPDHADQIWNVAKDSGVNILSDHELDHVLTDPTSNTAVGGLWSAQGPTNREISVAVHPNYRRKGIGGKLVGTAEQQWKWDKEAFGDDARLQANAVGEGMDQLLAGRGWEKHPNGYWQY
jgi:GNAT superfamily N-acetyltransferase